MISVALFGLGRIGITHLENLLNIKSFDLKIVCDHNLELAQEVAERYSIPQFTSRPEVIFEDDSIQAVVIVTSTTTHFELVTTALKAGKAVFVEKPLTIDLKQSLEIEKVLQETNGFCQVGFMRRFDDDYMEAKKAIDAGAIGKPLYFKGVSRDPFPPPISFIERSGGIFIDLMIHDIDLAHFLMGEKITEIAAFGSVIKYPDFVQANDVDQALAVLKFESGSVGDIEGSRCAFYGYDVRTEVVGTEGTLVIGSNRKNNVSILTNTGKHHEIIPVFQDRFTNAFVNELNAFAYCIEQQLPSPSSVEDSIQALKVAHAAASSLQKNGLLLPTNA